MARRKRSNSQYGNKTLWRSAQRNKQFATMLRNEIIAMALSRYKWVNLPDTCDERYLEMILLTQGIATIAAPRSGEHMGEWLSLGLGSWRGAPDRMVGNRHGRLSIQRVAGQRVLRVGQPPTHTRYAAH